VVAESRYTHVAEKEEGKWGESRVTKGSKEPRTVGIGPKLCPPWARGGGSKGIPIR